MYTTPRHKVFVSFHHVDQVYKEYFGLMMENDIVDESVSDGDIDDERLSTERGVAPELIVSSECLHGEGAPHCQDTTPVFDMIARGETTRNRSGGFGRASAASEWLVRHPAPIACRSV